MATNSKQARKQAQLTRKELRANYENFFRSLYHNSVTIDNLPEALPKRYLLRTLLNNGGIAYDKQTGLYLPYVYGGIDIYGLPKYYTLVGFNGFTVMRDASEVVILRANDEAYPIATYIDIQCDKLVEFDMTIMQNLEAVKTMTLIEVADRDTLLSFGNAQENRQLGSTVLYVNSSANLNQATTVMSTGAQYLVSNLLQDREKILNETLNHLGIGTANTQKAERVQTAEINASNGLAMESIKTLIDTFNHDAEIGGLTIRLRGNTDMVTDKELEVEMKENEVKEDVEL